MAAIAATTSRIRVGSAGVMLPHYSTLKVAEQFRVLEAIAPGRIDLGVGRAPGSDRITAMALNPDPQAPRTFPSRCRSSACGFAASRFPRGTRFARSGRIPRVPRPRRSGFSAAPTTARNSPRTLGSPMRTRTSSPTGAAPKRRSRPTGATPPQRRHAPPGHHLRVGAGGGHRGRGETPADDARALARGLREGTADAACVAEAAATHPYTEAERAIIQRLRERAIVGTAGQVVSRLEALAARSGWMNRDQYLDPRPGGRQRSYALIARAVMGG